MYYWIFSSGMMVLLIIGLIILAIVDCVKSNLKDIEKMLWIFIILSLNLIGVIIYYVFARKMGDHMKKRLFRSKKNKIIAGVCGGLGDYFDVDPTLIRFIWVVFLLGGVGFLAYILAWIIMPQK